MDTIKNLEKGDVVEITIANAVWGKVKILGISLAENTIKYRWEENPMTCYDNRLNCLGNVDVLPLYDITDVKVLEVAA